MLGRTHMVFGALFWAGGAGVVAEAAGMDLSPTEMAVGLGVASVASLLPDIDHPDSLLTRGWIPGAGIFGPLGRLLGKLLSIPPRIIGLLARSVMGHRGGTHSIAFMVLWTVGALPLYALGIALGAYILSVVMSVTPWGFSPDTVNHWLLDNVPELMPFVMLAVGIGYFSHLFADSLNTAPVPWLWPFSKHRFFFLPPGLRIKVESPAEWLLSRMLILVLIGVSFITIVKPLGVQIIDTAKDITEDPPALTSPKDAPKSKAKGTANGGGARGASSR